MEVDGWVCGGGDLIVSRLGRGAGDNGHSGRGDTWEKLES